MTNKNEELQERCEARLLYNDRNILKSPDEEDIEGDVKWIIQETKDSMGTQPPKAEPVDVKEFIDEIFDEWTTKDDYVKLTGIVHGFLSQSPQSRDEWVSVEERLPESVELVNIMFEDRTSYHYNVTEDNYRTYQGLGFIGHNNWVIFTVFNGEVQTHTDSIPSKINRGCKVIQWMSRPQPPKQVSEV